MVTQNDFDEIEQKAIEKTRKKKPKMKVSGKSVFLLQKEGGKIEDQDNES